MARHAHPEPEFPARAHTQAATGILPIFQQFMHHIAMPQLQRRVLCHGGSKKESSPTREIVVYERFPRERKCPHAVDEVCDGAACHGQSPPQKDQWAHNGYMDQKIRVSTSSVIKKKSLH
jgi:hypothetical protein